MSRRHTELRTEADHQYSRRPPTHAVRSPSAGLPTRHGARARPRLKFCFEYTLVKKKENRHTKRGMGGGQGPHLHEQGILEQCKDDQGHRRVTGEREWGAHRDTEGGWAGFTHTTVSQGFLSRIGRVAPARRHGGRRGPPTGCALLDLVLLLLTRDSDRFAARWTPYSNWRSLSTSDLPQASHWQSLAITGTLTGVAEAHAEGGTGAVIGVSHSVGFARPRGAAYGYACPRPCGGRGRGCVSVHACVCV